MALSSSRKSSQIVFCRQSWWATTLNPNEGSQGLLNTQLQALLKARRAFPPEWLAPGPHALPYYGRCEFRIVPHWITQSSLVMDTIRSWSIIDRSLSSRSTRSQGLLDHGMIDHCIYDLIDLIDHRYCSIIVDYDRLWSTKLDHDRSLVLLDHNRLYSGMID